MSVNARTPLRLSGRAEYRAQYSRSIRPSSRSRTAAPGMTKFLECIARTFHKRQRKAGSGLVLCRAIKRADLNRLEKRLGAPRFSFGKTELLLETLGVSPGSVTPFALMNDAEKRVTVVVDETFCEARPSIFIRSITPPRPTLRASDLVKFIEALGYKPLISDCGPESVSKTS